MPKALIISELKGVGSKVNSAGFSMLFAINSWRQKKLFTNSA